MRRVEGRGGFGWLGGVLLAAFALAFAWAGTAQAAGTVKFGKTTLTELEGEWAVSLTLTLPRAPELANVPMRFSFTPTAYYERAQVDGDRIVENTIPLRDQVPKVESMPVPFLDPRTGKIQKATRFSFRLARSSGFNAGEYLVKVTDSRTDTEVGQATTFKLKGENPVIDRRTLVFQEGPAKAKKPATELTDVQPGVFRTTDGEVIATAGKAGTPTPEKQAWDNSPAIPAPAAQRPAPVAEKPGACGCRATGQSSRLPGSFAAALALLALVVGARRRRTGA